MQLAGLGLGNLMLAGVPALFAAGTARSATNVRIAQFAPRARRVIFLYMSGGPSHLDLLDYKPALTRVSGQSVGKNAVWWGSPFEFQQHGESGLWMSELLPGLARHADSLCLVHSLQNPAADHAQGRMMLHCGSARFVRPTVGSWVVHALGTENSSLPAFVSLLPATGSSSQTYTSAFLPGTCHGTRLDLQSAQAGNRGVVGNLSNPRLTRAQQRRQIDLAQSLNRQRLEIDMANPILESSISSLELADAMQSSIPRAADLSQETKATHEAYGIHSKSGDDFGRACLLARRMLEAGVRFVEVTKDGWDHHGNLVKGIRNVCGPMDQAVGALLDDLAMRGLLEDTLVFWGGEFGRAPQSTNASEDSLPGRDHNPKGFTVLLAGGGIKPGFRYGATDEMGREAVENPLSIHDLHATMLHLLGFDHERLTYRYSGRDFRLTDVGGSVIRDLLA